MPAPLVVIQRNPISGSGRGRLELLRLWKALRHAGCRVRMFSSRSRLDQWIRQLSANSGLRCIVAAGGDGTAADVINRYPEIPVALLPLGTENLLARFCGLTRSGRRLAEIILSNHIVTLDSAVAGTRSFLLMASAGPDAAVVDSLHRDRCGPITRATYLLPTLRALLLRPLVEYRVTSDAAESPCCGVHVLVTNIPRYGFGLKFSPEAVPGDGLLDVRVYHTRSRWKMLMHLACLKLGWRVQESNVRRFRAREVWIEVADAGTAGGNPLATEVCQCDGDPGPALPVQIRVLPASIRLMIPERSVALLGGNDQTCDASV